MSIDTPVSGFKHHYILRFAVEPGAVVYAGTIRFHRSSPGGSLLHRARRIRRDGRTVPSESPDAGRERRRSDSCRSSTAASRSSRTRPASRCRSTPRIDSARGAHAGRLVAARRDVLGVAAAVDVRLGLAELEHAVARARAGSAGRARRRASCPRSRRAPRSASPWSRGRGGWSARRARGSSAGRRACARARAAPSRRRRARGSASRRRRRRSRSAPASVRSEPIDAFGKRVLERLPDAVARARAAPSRAARSSRASRWRRAPTVPASGCDRAGDQLEQRRLAGAVHAHHAPALAAADQEVEAVVDHARAVRLAHARELRDVVARARRRRKSNSSVWRRLGGSTFSIFSSFFTRDCTCAAWLARALKRAMKRLLLGEHRLLARVLRRPARARASARCRS